MKHHLSTLKNLRTSEVRRYLSKGIPAVNAVTLVKNMYPNLFVK